MVNLVKAYKKESDDPVQTAEVHRLMHSERRIVNLLAKLECLRNMAGPISQDEMEVHATGVVNEEVFRINRDVKPSKRKIDPFAEECVKEITTKYVP